MHPSAGSAVYCTCVCDLRDVSQFENLRLLIFDVGTIGSKDILGCRLSLAYVRERNTNF